VRVEVVRVKVVRVEVVRVKVVRVKVVRVKVVRVKVLRVKVVRVKVVRVKVKGGEGEGEVGEGEGEGEGGEGCSDCSDVSDVVMLKEDSPSPSRKASGVSLSRSLVVGDWRDIPVPLLLARRVAHLLARAAVRAALARFVGRGLALSTRA
jgi:hypothetical protein